MVQHTDPNDFPGRLPGVRIRCPTLHSQTKMIFYEACNLIASFDQIKLTIAPSLFSQQYHIVIIVVEKTGANTFFSTILLPMSIKSVSYLFPLCAKTSSPPTPARELVVISEHAFLTLRISSVLKVSHVAERDATFIIS